MAAWGDGLSGGFNYKVMKLNIEFPNLDVKAKRIGNFGEKIKRAIPDILKKSIFLVERYAKIEAPVRTGRLRASIGGGGFSGGTFAIGEGIEFGDRFARIGPTVVYARFVHSNNPFMSRGLEKAVPEIKKVAKDAVSEALR